MANEKIRLYLSGGSNRSSLGSLGAIMFLIFNDAAGEYHWSEVDEVIGVSGGSQPLAAIMAGLNRGPSQPRSYKKQKFTDPDELRTIDSLSAFYQAVSHDGEHWKAFRRRSIVIAVIALASLPLLLFALSAMLPGIIAFPLGLIAIPVVYRIGARLLSGYLRDILSSFVEAADKADAGYKKSLYDLARGAGTYKPQRSYFIGTAGLASGSNYFYWCGQGFANLPADFEADLKNLPAHAVPSGISRSDTSVVDATLASCSLPPLSQPGNPPVTDVFTKTNKWEQRPSHAPDKEALLDGGYGGNFGAQISQRVLQDISQSLGGVVGPSPTLVADRRIIAVDAGRREEGGGLLAKLARGVSTVVRLIRVVQVSVAATYVNDIQDLEDVDGSVIAVSRPLDTTTPPSPLAASNSDLKEIEERLCKLIQANAVLSLTNLDPVKAEIAVIAGVVGLYVAEVYQREANQNTLGGTMAKYGSNSELDQVLKTIGVALNTQTDLDIRWHSSSITDVYDDLLKEKKIDACPK